MRRILASLAIFWSMLLAGQETVAAQGIISIGPAETFAVQGGFTQSATGTLEIELGGDKAPPRDPPFEKSGRLVVGGQVTLNGNLKLDVTPSIKLKVGQIFLIIDNKGENQVRGHFIGLPEGEEFKLGEWRLRISYESGDGNDVTLTVVAADRGRRPE